MLLFIQNSQARTLVVTERGGVGGGGGGCNRVHLHVVFVLYSVCRSVSVLSCVYVIQSFTNVLPVETSLVRKREKRGKKRPLACTHQKEKKK